MKNIRSLQINADNFGNGGISVVIWRIKKELDNYGVCTSFLTQNETIDNNYYDDIKTNGGELFKIEGSSNKVYRYVCRYKGLRQILEKNEFDVVHINADEALGIIAFYLAARDVSIKRIIVHAHTTSFKKNKYVHLQKILHNICLRIIKTGSVVKFACSEKARNFFWGSDKEVLIVPNGLKFDDYKFSSVERERIRHYRGVENEKLIFLHIGRFVYAKNHEFLIKIFAKIAEKNKNTELWLIGEEEGDCYDVTKKMIYKYNLREKIKFIGTTSKIKEYLSAADVFVFPSRFEGFPLVLIEAQANGIPILCSESITKEAVINDNVKMISLEEGIDIWVSECLKDLKRINSETCRSNLTVSGMDIKVIARSVYEKYI